MTFRSKSPLIIAAVVLLVCSALGQLTVDATARDKGPVFGTIGARYSSIGRKLPVQLTIELQGAPFNSPFGRTAIEFVLVNTGKQELTIPLSPNGSDVESTNSFRKLSFHVTFGRKGDPWGHDRRLLQAGSEPQNNFVTLYGSAAIPATLATLRPGQSIRVRAEVALPHVSEGGQVDSSFVAGAAMSDTTIMTVDNKRLMDSQDVGSAASPEYTSQELLKSIK